MSYLSVVKYCPCVHLRQTNFTSRFPVLFSISVIVYLLARLESA